MPRATSIRATRARHKRVLKLAKGNWGSRSKHFRPAVETVERGLAYATRDRRVKKREFRSLWTARISAAAKKCGTSYNRLISGLKKANVLLDRKILAELSVNDSAAFDELAKLAKQQ